MLDYQNRPLSYAAAFFSGLYTKKGQNLKPEDFNVFERVNKDKESKRLIPQPAAQLILDELAEQRVPDWVVALMDVGALRAAAVR
ncbi:MAG: hypothetical protein AAGA75_24405 [Cyanobacteria bacterium P01_E01_bin.6]